MALALACACGIFPMASLSAEATIEERLRSLEKWRAESEAAIAARDARIRELEAELARLKGPQTEATAESAAKDDKSAAEAELEASQVNQPFGLFTPGAGFTVARTDWGELQLSVYSYLRYLNQQGLDDSYEDHFGNTRPIDIRNDLELNKLFLYTKGWIFDPRLRYMFYVWASAPSLGSSSSILAAGNLSYTFTDALTVTAGVIPLPTSRSMEGQFPFWDRVDTRYIADEMLRGSFTQGVSINGRISDTVNYKLALGNNLSAFGVSAARLDDRFDTISAGLTWMPTTGEFGPRANFGDFEGHDALATLFSVHLTSSTEDRESQPGLDTPENTQIRLSDGVTVFTPDALAPGVTVNQVDYLMLSLSGGLKLRGFYLEGELFRRRLDDFRTSGISPVGSLVDDGLQMQASMMLVPSSFQLYAGASKIWGDYGNPWDASIGANWWPFRKRGFRVNGELLRLEQSPVGSSSLPYPVGGSGWVFSTNVELAF